MDGILRRVEILTRDELVWLATYLSGRLRALPPPGDCSVAQRTAHQPPESADPGVSYGNACPTLVSGPAPSRTLTERIEARNFSMDPWECTGSAPQGWETHLQRSIVPIQGYIQLCPCEYLCTCPCVQSHVFLTALLNLVMWTWSTMIIHVLAASKGSSILRGSPIPLPACHQLCNQCSRKKCCLRYLHDFHACYWCNLHPGCVPTPLGVGTRIQLDVLVKKLRIDERKMREWLAMILGYVFGLPNWSVLDYEWWRCYVREKMYWGWVRTGFTLPWLLKVDAVVVLFVFVWCLCLVVALLVLCCGWLLFALFVFCLAVLVFSWLSVSNRMTFAMLTHKLWSTGDDVVLVEGDTRLVALVFTQFLTFLRSFGLPVSPEISRSRRAKKKLSKGKRAWSWRRTSAEVAAPAMIQVRTYRSREGNGDLRSRIMGRT